jgi:hypothetical protein
MKDDFALVKVSKIQFDYWHEKGTLGEVVKLQGNVEVLVRRQDFENYINHIDGWKMSKDSVKKILKTPAKLLEIAMYEHYEDLMDEFDI